VQELAWVGGARDKRRTGAAHIKDVPHQQACQHACCGRGHWDANRIRL